MRDKPYFITGFVRLLGFLQGYMRAEERPVPDEFVKYLRSEQLKRIASFLSC
jgi:hypothetical protein